MTNRTLRGIGMDGLHVVLADIYSVHRWLHPNEAVAAHIQELLPKTDICLYHLGSRCELIVRREATRTAHVRGADSMWIRSRSKTREGKWWIARCRVTNAEP